LNRGWGCFPDWAEHGTTRFSGFQPLHLKKLTLMKRLLKIVFILNVIAVFGQSGTVSKVGYADIGYIVSRLPEFKNLQGQYAEAEKNYKEQLQQKGELFQKDYQEYLANSASMTDTVRAGTEQKLQDAQTAIQNYQTEAQQSLANYQKLLLAPLYLAVNSTIQKVAQENGYSVVINARAGNNSLTLFHEDRFDISDLVVKRMTAEEPKETPSTPAKKAPVKKN
jgi:outer membrane protein